jgi:DNA methylase
MAVDFTKWTWNALPKDFMIELIENLGHQDYTELEWASAQRRLRRLLEPLTRQGYRTDLKGKHAKSKEQSWNNSHGLDGVIGEVIGFSHKTVHERDKVLGWLERYPNRYANIHKMIDADQISISSAHDQIERDIKKRKIMSRAPKIKLPPEQFQLYPHDFSSEQALKLIPADSIDLIFTDPPYDKASLPLYGELAKFGAHVLRPGGCLVTYLGQYYLPEIIGIFAQEKSLSYVWTFASPNSGHNARVYERKVFACYKPLLMYIKGTKPTCDDFMPDVIGSKLKAPSKILHPWEQSIEEAEHFIKYRSYEGQIVLDPMLGTGTSAIAALKHKRKFIGFEKDPDTLKIAHAKIGQWLKDNGARNSLNS